MISEKTHNYLRNRFVALAEKATEYKAKIDSAKTQLKKDFYSKKLKKVNSEAMDVLILLNSANNQNTTNDLQDDMP